MADDHWEVLWNERPFWQLILVQKINYSHRENTLGHLTLSFGIIWKMYRVR